MNNPNPSRIKEMNQISNALPFDAALTLSDEALEWWRGAVIYQVYPRSFYDTNADGIGDLRGITQKMDYIANLGVDAIWVSPFFKSPMKDFGYDISDYRDVDPLFGTLADFDELLAAAKKANIKVMIDQVLSHTSDQHPWFIESRQSQNNPKSDWYVWADAKEDGSPPNNWHSIFGGGAWEWSEERQQYYFHNFLRSQPDLNYHCPELRAQIIEEIEFWLKRGVDGFRLDAINFCYHDKELRDNPIKPIEERVGRGFSADNPYAAQYHYYDNTQPENLSFLEDVRALLDKYPGTVTLGEINSENSLASLAEYTQGHKRLHMGYSFELLADEYSADYIRNTVNELESVLKEGWSCWSISNHDVERVVSRWGTGRYNDELAKMLLTLTASLRGTICVYQGEELGLTQASVSKEQLKDPFGIEFWPEFKGRDGCRTPMVWDSEKLYADFSTVETWLPIAPDHYSRCVKSQASNSQSVLNYYKNFLAWRKQQKPLIVGDIEFIEMPDTSNILLIQRSHGDTKMLVALNLCDDVSVAVRPEGLTGFTDVIRSESCDVNADNGEWTFQPYGFCFISERT